MSLYRSAAAQEQKVAEVRDWIEATGRMTNLHIGGIAERVRDAEANADLVDAISAVLASESSAWGKLAALREFLVQQLLVEPEPKPFVSTQRTVSPYDVPQAFLRGFFEGGSAHGLWEMQIRQYYDSFEIDPDSPCAFRPGMSVRLFSNANIGYRHKTNLQVAGQLTFNGKFLATSWWIVTLSEVAERFLAQCAATVEVNSRIVAECNALALAREHHPLFVPIPERSSFHARFEHTIPPQADVEVPRGAPLFLYIEGWHRQEVR